MRSIYIKSSRYGRVPLPAIAGTTAIFNNHILRARINYQFMRALSLRAISDYNAALPNTLVIQPHTKRISPDVLFI
jgi:hypothetical protein